MKLGTSPDIDVVAKKENTFSFGHDNSCRKNAAQMLVPILYHRDGAFDEIEFFVPVPTTRSPRASSCSVITRPKPLLTSAINHVC